MTNLEILAIELLRDKLDHGLRMIHDSNMTKSEDKQQEYWSEGVTTVAQVISHLDQILGSKTDVYRLPCDLLKD